MEGREGGVQSGAQGLQLGCLRFALMQAVLHSAGSPHCQSTACLPAAAPLPRIPPSSLPLPLALPAAPAHQADHHIEEGHADGHHGEQDNVAGADDQALQQSKCKGRRGGKDQGSKCRVVAASSEASHLRSSTAWRLLRVPTDPAPGASAAAPPCLPAPAPAHLPEGQQVAGLVQGDVLIGCPCIN